jgi:HD-GYP domain-containing protein (c-di-GMP phosphodiesterase class II)
MLEKIIFFILDNKESRVEKLSKIIESIDLRFHVVYTSDDNSAIENLNFLNNIVLLVNNDLVNEEIKSIFDKKIKQKDCDYYLQLTENDLFDSKSIFDDYININDAVSLIKFKLKNSLTLLDYKITINEESNKLKELNFELEQDIDDILVLTSQIIQLRLPGAKEKSQRINEATSWIADKLQLEDFEKRDLRFASYICLSGRLSLTDELLRQPILVNGLNVNPQLKQVPIAAKSSVDGISRFHNLEKILYHVYENLDGSGFPSGLQAWQIPLESRVLRVVLDYEEELERNALKPDEIMVNMINQAKRVYDHRVVHLMDQFIRTENREQFDPTVTQVKLLELSPNQEVARDVYSINGLKLISKNTKLTESNILFLTQHGSHDPILGNIFIKKD